ncbi:hypothetical protein ACF3M1_08215 [Luteimonas sp. WGS1318]|uniref:hypothetical protein n=1 Tax=Luteimonas sp. WGS1318 TaxID=3366815 RepID=UPI00372CF38A
MLAAQQGQRVLNVGPVERGRPDFQRRLVSGDRGLILECWISADASHQGEVQMPANHVDRERSKCA